MSSKYPQKRGYMGQGADMEKAEINILVPARQLISTLQSTYTFKTMDYIKFFFSKIANYCTNFPQSLHLVYAVRNVCRVILVWVK
jgi:hypothetical protein